MFCPALIVYIVCFSCCYFEKLMLWFGGRFYPKTPYLCTVIDSHMRLCVAVLQSLSHFSICHRYSLLCYLTSCSVVCHLFCFCKMYTVFLFVTQCDCDVPALSSRHTATLCVSKHFVLLSSATKGSIYLYILSYFYLAQHATKLLFHCQRKMHISIDCAIHYTFMLLDIAQHEMEHWSLSCD